ncbi:TadE/TadG family type IV pilus assembly protein [Pelagibius marinus]|uniref:TadE/TadG family type IV pilus assembly protein n=1 Tax=Pelagibius marinus TaxID=2762760 RepID=UPI0018732879|nr:TadE family protein [Pelagibius marinus]
MVTVEGAFVATILGLLLIGVIDFGLAYKRHAELENAVRAGTQYALVRRPQQGDIDPIRDAVWATAPFYEGAPGTALDVEFYCECPDGTPSQCSAPGGVALCSGGFERSAFVRVRLSQDFDLLFAYPGVGTSVDLSAEGSVRLN